LDAADSLNHAYRYGYLQATACPEAIKFIHKHTSHIVSILLEDTKDICDRGQSCIDNSLWSAIQIVKDELENTTGEFNVLYVLGHLFDIKNYHYHSTDGKCLERHSYIGATFGCGGGFALLAMYLNHLLSSNSQFPTSIDLLYQLLGGIHLHTKFCLCGDMYMIAETVMEHVLSLNDEEEPTEADLVSIEGLRDLLRQICMKIPSLLSLFFPFWRKLTLQLVSSQSLEVQLFGWEEIKEFAMENKITCHLPVEYIVSGSGSSFINGRYKLDLSSVKKGVCMTLRDPVYRRIVATDDADVNAAGKTFTLFRCIMRSGNKWWFISEADEEQPGTDRDIDYYQHDSAREHLPPSSGWKRTRRKKEDCKGITPPPTLEACNLLFQEKDQKNVVAKWEDEVIKILFSDSTRHLDVVNRSKALLNVIGQDRNFEDVALHLDTTSSTSKFPHLIVIKNLLEVNLEFVLADRQDENHQNTSNNNRDIMSLLKPVIKHVQSEEVLGCMNFKYIDELLLVLFRTYIQLFPQFVQDFFVFWRKFILVPPLLVQW